MTEKKEFLHLQIDKSLKDELKKVAKANHLTVASFVKVMINEKVKEYNGK